MTVVGDVSTARSIAQLTNFESGPCLLASLLFLSSGLVARALCVVVVVVVVVVVAIAPSRRFGAIEVSSLS